MLRLPAFRVATPTTIAESRRGSSWSNAANRPSSGRSYARSRSESLPYISAPC